MMDVLELEQPDVQRAQLEYKLAQTKGKLQESVNQKEKTIEKVGEFVGYFYGMMLQKMRETIPEDPLFHGGRGEEIFSQQLDFHIGDMMAKESNHEVTKDGYKRKRINPLTKDMSESLLKSLDGQIDYLEKRIEGLENSLTQKESAVSEGSAEQLLEDLETLSTLGTQRQLDEMKVVTAGRASSLLESSMKDSRKLK